MGVRPESLTPSSRLLEISLLQFSRKLPEKNWDIDSKLGDKLAPQLPRRKYLDEDDENRPPLPQRLKKNPPPKPSKTLSHVTAEEDSFSINLFQPVARKTDTIGVDSIKKDNNYGENIVKSGISSELKEHKSFFDLENDIVSTNHSKPFKTNNPPPKPEKLLLELDNPKLPKRPETKFEGKFGNINEPKPQLKPNSKPTWLSNKSVSTKPEFSLSKPSSESHTSNSQWSKGTGEADNIGSTICERKLPPDIGKKPTSWIDSAMKKNDISSKPEIPSKPAYTIRANVASSKPSAEEGSNSSNELSNKYGSPGLSSKTKPNIGSKPPIEIYVQKEQELLTKAKSQLSSKPVVPRSSKPSLDKYITKDAEVLKSTIDRLSPNKNSNATKNYEEADSKELKAQLRLLSTSPSRFGQSSFANYKEKDNEILQAQLKKLGTKPVKYQPIEKPVENIEGLAALSKLKPVKPPKLRQASTFPETKKPAANKPDNEAPLDFKSQLSSLLNGAPTRNPHVTPNANSNGAQIRSKDDIKVEYTPKPEKLVHPNKSRSKGPKRRLPKNKTTTEEPLVVSKPRKPPVPRNKPKVVVRPRITSGEIFI